MRTIKFRAWNRFENEMDYDVCINEKGRVIAFEYGNYSGSYKTADYIPMQFTGLHDKNGREIYEGDIVKTSQGGSVICYDSCQAKYKTVPFNLYKANAGDGGWTGFDLRYAQEVIGNIYETPELLK